MSIQEQILELLITLKRTKDPNEKKKIKDKLKKLYNTFNRVSRKKVKFISPYKEEIKDIINPIKQSILTEKQKITLLKNTVKNEIKELKVLRDEATPKEKKKIEALIEEKQIEEQIVNDGVKNKEPLLNIVEKVEQIKKLKHPDQLEHFSIYVYRKYKNDPRTLNLQLSNAVRKVYGKDIDRIKERVQHLIDTSSIQVIEEDEWQQEEEQAKREAEAEIKRLGKIEALTKKNEGKQATKIQRAFRRKKASEAQAQAQAQKEMEAKQQDPLDLLYEDVEATQQFGDEFDKQRLKIFKSLASDLDNPIIKRIIEARKRDEPTAKLILSGVIDEVLKGLPEGEPLPKQLQEFSLDIGQGKRKSKSKYMKNNLKGGAGIADWMMTLGSIPGVPQLMNNMGPFGQVLGNASGLAQSFGKTAGQLMKEQSKDGEKVAGFTDILGGPLKSFFGSGKPPAVIKKFQTHLLKGGSLKDFWNKHKSKLLAIGIPTATMLGALASIKIGDKMIKDKNKALGIVERVKPDFFSKGTIEPTQDVFDEPQPFTEQAPLSFNWGGRGVNMADVAGGAFLSDFLGTIGGITPKISGLVGAVPTYGKVATIGNSALGSFSRVGQDIAKMLGLGNMDLSGKSPRTKVGHGNMDLTGKTKGYGKKKLKGGFLPLLAMMGMGEKKGGRKMLPYDRPMPRFEEGMAHIQPYNSNLLEGGYGLTDMLIGATGDLIKSGVKGLANAGVSVAKDIAKKGVQELANKSINAIGKGKKKIKGCGKINGKYVSSEFEDNYENQVMKAMLMDKMSKIMAEQQMEGQIQQNMNMEQASALQQLQYYDMLNKLQQRQ